MKCSKFDELHFLFLEFSLIRPRIGVMGHFCDCFQEIGGGRSHLSGLLAFPLATVGGLDRPARLKGARLPLSPSFPFLTRPIASSSPKRSSRTPPLPPRARRRKAPLLLHRGSIARNPSFTSLRPVVLCRLPPRSCLGKAQSGGFPAAASIAGAKRPCRSTAAHPLRQSPRSRSRRLCRLAPTLSRYFTAPVRRRCWPSPERHLRTPPTCAARPARSSSGRSESTSRCASVPRSCPDPSLPPATSPAVGTREAGGLLC